ncbi:MAG: phosphoenolpyruvate-utilizing N-terminal domain-containing protein [bacterium]
MTLEWGGGAGAEHLSGRSLCAGDTFGRALWVGRETWTSPTERIEQGCVARELNTFRHALLCALTEAKNARDALVAEDLGPADQALVLVNQHIHALCDAVWVADVESLVMTEHLSVRSAIHKVLVDAQRVAHLVRDPQPRRRARRLAGVGRCVLAGLDERRAAPALHPPGTGTVLLVSDELFLADLLPAGPVCPVAVVCAAGLLGEDLLSLLQARGMPAVELESGVPVVLQNGDWLRVTAREPGQEGRVGGDPGGSDALLV